MTRYEVQAELLRLGKRQFELANEIKTRYGEKISSPELSNILAGRTGDGDKNRRVLKAVEEILADWKGGENHGI